MPSVMSADTLIERIDRILPQTQCGQCGFNGCRTYAEAIVNAGVTTDRCPPGGDEGARAIAHIVGVAARPYDRSRGIQQPPQVARVVEEVCIGCTKCIQACPVDAIVGAAKWMHTVLPALCTGCSLCVPACPMDCIQMDFLNEQ